MLPDLPADAIDAWPRLERALAAHAPAVLADLAPGADAAALADLATQTGLTLPESLRAYYAAHDGQRGDAPGLFFGLYALSAEAAGTEWANWTSLLRDDPSLNETIAVTAQPEGAVEAVYAHPGWLPIASDGAGNHLAVDLAPGPQGTAGQVISFGTDEPVRRVLAPSVRHLVAWMAQALETGTVTATDDGFQIGEATNLLDALPALLP